MPRANAVGLLLLALLLAAGCGREGGSKAGRPYDRAALKAAVLGKSLDDVRKLLGPPDDVQAAATPAPHEGYWLYKGRAGRHGRKDSPVEETTYLWYGNGRVNEIMH